MDNAVQAFLTGLIDDAGLFPPAALPMDAAVQGHQQSEASRWGWMMDRFVCPASRLGELVDALPADAATTPWDLAVVVDSDFDPRIQHPGVVFRLAEVRGLPDFDPHPSIEVFCEQVDIVTCLENGHGAKLRCGGATADLFPSPDEVADFLAECNERGVRAKATAGLHHPIRHVDSATGITNHGFLNVVGAAVLAHARGLDRHQLAEVVADDDPASFALDADQFRWRDHTVAAGDITKARQALFVSYGSCSFTEPVDDLKAMGILS